MKIRARGAYLECRKKDGTRLFARLMTGRDNDAKRDIIGVLDHFRNPCALVTHWTCLVSGRSGA